MIWRAWGFDPSSLGEKTDFTHAASDLVACGPLIRVEIHSVSINPSEPDTVVLGKSTSVVALLDTGANVTVVTPDIIKAIDPIFTGFEGIATASETKECATYIGQIGLPWGSTKITKIIECPLPPSMHQCLIGRDLMKNWTMIYDGTAGSLTICDSGR